MPISGRTFTWDRAVGLLRRRVARPLLHGARRPILMRRMAKASEVDLLGHRLRTDPRVFHPTYFSSSRVLAEHIVRIASPGMDLLDMGTGSGAVAVTAAARGANVTACDLNPSAVALARVNARANGVSVEVLDSDLFAALEQRRFDVIAFNIPFYKSEPRTHYEAAFRTGTGFETVHRFAAGARDHLAPTGRVIIVFSEDCDHDETLGAFTSCGLSLVSEQVAVRSFERFYVATFELRV